MKNLLLWTGWFLRTIYEALMPESSHFNSNQHRGIRVSPRTIVLVNVPRASGDGEGSDDRKVGCNMSSAKVIAVLRPFRGSAIGSAVVLLVSFSAYHLHFNLSAAASLDILIVLFITLWFGFWQATATSFAAVACLAYFFAPPILSFYVADPHNWVALAVFELTALIVSQLSTQAQNQKRRAVLLHDNAARLYDFSRSILVLNRREPAGAQIASLIQKNIGADAVVILDATIPRLYAAGGWTQEDEELARSAYFQNTNSERRNSSRWQRVLHNGSRPIGALVLSGDRLTSLMADAIASLVIVAFERARSFEKEMQAEAERQSEQFRTTVLDGLAHAFKTPLTVILASTSGLIETWQLTESQAELVGLIDQHANKLSGLTNHCLQMARLESKAIEPRLEEVAVPSLIEEIAAECCDRVGKHSIRVDLGAGDPAVSGDRHLLAMTITELIVNAAKYASVDSPITISVLELGSKVVVSVHNEGSVIDSSEQWNVTIERELTPATSLRVSYVGMNSYRLNVTVNWNQIAPSARPYVPSPVVDPRAPFQNWGVIYETQNYGGANYQAMEVEATHRTSKGLYFSANYSWAHNISDAQGDAPAGFADETAYGLAYLNRFDISADRGNVDGTRRQRFLLTGTYDLPFGEGRKWSSSSSLLNRAFGDWSLNTITLLETGPYLTPTINPQFDQTNTDPELAGSIVRPNIVGNPIPAHRTPSNYFNLSAFAPTPVGAARIGNAGVGMLEGPGTVAVSAGLAKSMAIRENTHLRFEATFTNVLNHTNYAPPATNVSSPSTFGVLDAQQTAENAGNRTGQLALRFEF
jgi:signal transduction histidine kinase